MAATAFITKTLIMIRLNSDLTVIDCVWVSMITPCILYYIKIKIFQTGWQFHPTGTMSADFLIGATKLILLKLILGINFAIDPIMVEKPINECNLYSVKRVIENKYFSGFLVFLCLLFTLPAMDQEQGSVYIKNYGANDYNAHSQNWGIGQDKRGVLYFANGNGVLEFDGTQWRLIPLEKTPIARTIHCSADNIIYVGGNNDFGFLKPDEQGFLHYESLWDRLTGFTANAGSISYIYSLKKEVYFMAKGFIFLYADNQLTVFDLDQVKDPAIFSEVMPKNNFILFKYKHNLLTIFNRTIFKIPIEPIIAKNSSFQPILSNENEIIERTAQGQYIIHRLNGFVPGDDSQKSAITLSRNVCQYLETHLLYSNCAVRMDQERYVFGTNNGGVLLCDHHGTMIRVFNRQSGLAANDVTSVFADNQGNVWITGNKGISLIEVNSRLEFFKENEGLEFGVLSLLRFKDTLYAGTFGGIYVLNPYWHYNQSNKLRFQPLSGNTYHCWSLIELNGELFSAGLKGVFHVHGRQEQLIFPGNIATLGKTLRFPHTLFIGTIDGLTALTVKTEKSGSIKILHSFNNQGGFTQFKSIEVTKIVSDAKGDLWLSTYDKGIRFIRFTGETPDQFDTYVFNENHGLSRPDWNMVHWINQQLWVGTMKGIYHPGPLPPNSDYSQLNFSPLSFLNKTINTPGLRCHRMAMDQHQTIWISHFQGFSQLILDKNNCYQRVSDPFAKVDGLVEQLLVEDNGIVWLGATNGLFRYVSTRPKNYRIPFNTLIRKIVVNNSRGIYGGAKNHGQTEISISPVLPYLQNSLKFYFSAPYFEHGHHNHYRFLLSPFDPSWSAWDKQTDKEYTNLPEGNYQFMVKAKNIFNQESAADVFHFSIMPPWFRTWWAYLIDTALLMAIFLIGIRFNSKRLLSAKKRLEGIISDRTAEVIAQKNEIENYAGHLYQTNQKLIETQDALWGEMELAKKIQTVLLPKEPVIPGYEMAVYMQPADEVGGDYYDVIRVEEEPRLEVRSWRLDSERAEEKDEEPCRGGSCARPHDSGQFPKTNPENPSNLFSGESSEFAPIDPSTLFPSHWLVIGDVSGHGVPAGLIMMMVQTALHTLSATQPQCSPAEVLIYLNKVIERNIKKMDEDKYMTLTLMRIASDQTISYSGLHQDMLVFRSDLGQTEWIGTRGMWIGIMDEINNDLFVDYLELNPGDIILLYTDGITEAIDPEGHMFSSEKLQQVLQTHGRSSPENIKAALLLALGNYQCHDDITFVIVKKK
jgi:serine phosphatase RsbU (regulator of sigma subunit)